MRNLKLLDRFKSTQIHSLNSQESSSTSSTTSSKLNSPRIKFIGFPKFNKNKSASVSDTLLSYGFPSTELMEPTIEPHLMPIDFVERLSNLYQRLASCSQSEMPMLFIEQYTVLRGLGDPKLLRRCLRDARRHAIDVPSKVVLSAWSRYERREDELVGVNSIDCSGFLLECPKASLVLGYDPDSRSDHCECLEGGKESVNSESLIENEVLGEEEEEEHSDVVFCIGTEEIKCVRSRIASLSIPFQAMLYGDFAESRSCRIDFTGNDISTEGMRAFELYSRKKRVDLFQVETILELLELANKYCCDDLKSSCDAHLASLITNINDALIFIEYSLEQHAYLLAASCLQIVLRELPSSLHNSELMRIFCGSDSRERLHILGVHALFLLYYFLSQVSMEEKIASNTILSLLERMKNYATEDWQKTLAFHQLGCIFLFRKEYKIAQCYFESASSLGHIYSLAGVARTSYKLGHRYTAYKVLNSIVSKYKPTGWMFQERSLYNVANEKLKDLDIATELDPALSFPYKYRAVMKAMEKNTKEAVSEIDRIIRFKLTPDCLELRAWLFISSGEYECSVRDIRAILSLEPNYMLFCGNVRGDHMVELLSSYLSEQSEADCWMKLYEKWSLVDDISSLAVIHQMLQADPAKNFLRFRQSLLLLRLNCQKAAMRCLRMARNHTDYEHERLVYEGWILYDTGHHEEALSKAEKSVSVQRSFEAFFLKAYILADKNLDGGTYSRVIQLLEEALRCPSDGLRKGQALNNLGSIFVDSGKLDVAANCYANALEIKHTRAHQGLARVYFLKNQRKAAYDEISKLIEKAYNKASAYEKRSEYCERDAVKSDLDMATQLDPLRTYPYRYRAAVLMDNQKEAKAVEELSKAIAFKPDFQMLHLRAAFQEAIGNISSAVQDCEAALCLDPNHLETLDLYNRSKNQAAFHSGNGFDP